MQALKMLKFSSIINQSRRLSSLVEVGYDTLAWKKSEYRVAVVKMNNPPVNSFSTPLLKTLGPTFKKIISSDKIHGLVLTSALPKNFSAGLELTELVNTDRARLGQYWSMVQDFWYTLYSSPVPTVVVVNGNCFAGGVLLTVAADYRIASSGQYGIGVTAAKIGLVPPPWFQECICDIIGRRKAELMLSQGKVFTPEEALKFGLIDEVCDGQDFMPSALRSLAPFMEVDAASRVSVKLSLRSKIIRELESDRERDRDAFVDFVLSPSVQEKLVSYIRTLKKQ